MGQTEPIGDAPPRAGQSLPLEMLDPTAAERWPALRGPLTACDRLLTDGYESADRDAVRHQRQHRVLAGLAAICGTAAVLFAIIQLGYPVHFPWIAAAEVVATVAAL